jgi:hypothetical protein
LPGDGGLVVEEGSAFATVGAIRSLHSVGMATARSEDLRTLA